MINKIEEFVIQLDTFLTFFRPKTFKIIAFIPKDITSLYSALSRSGFVGSEQNFET